MNAKAELGRRGEGLAARFLERQGYAIRARNFRRARGEIDLVATHDGYLVFVEVKTRTAGAPLHPSLSVTARKREKLRQLGALYCAEHPELALQPRFDVVSVELGGHTRSIEHLINAF
ncbi:MAG: YraN family protein [Candidatus Lambdaproteobacteria bacterium]|nr:YraN family protein [Candidatus Lambdaproteobacteria bacterium]